MDIWQDTKTKVRVTHSKRRRILEWMDYIALEGSTNALKINYPKRPIVEDEKQSIIIRLRLRWMVESMSIGIDYVWRGVISPSLCSSSYGDQYENREGILYASSSSTESRNRVIGIPVAL